VFLFIRIFCFAAIVPALLRLQLPRLEALLTPTHGLQIPEPAKIQDILVYVDGVIQLGRPVIRPGCLTRGITMYYFLRRAGLDVSLYFGMGTQEDDFIGHCWLVNEGKPFLEARDPRSQYTVMYQFD
jgi:hypothetical protein